MDGFDLGKITGSLHRKDLYEENVLGYNVNVGANTSCMNGGRGGSIGDIIGGNVWNPSDVYQYYWSYPAVIYEKSKVDIAFKLIKSLIEKKIINDDKLTVGKFIEIVNTIASEL